MSAHRLPPVTISGLVLSDLFFNAPHPSYDEQTSWLQTDLAPELQLAQRNTALTEDALAFCFDNGLNAKQLCANNTFLADALVTDFLARL